MRFVFRHLRLLAICVLLNPVAAAPSAQIVIPQARKATPAAETKQETSQEAITASKELELTGKDTWKDTGLDVQPGDRIAITASGKVKYSDARQESGPEGLPRGWRDLIRVLPLNTAGRGALLGRIGDAAASQPFLAGAKLSMEAGIGGRLYLAINHTSNDVPKGSFRVRVEITRPEASPVVAARGEGKEVPAIPGADAALFEKIPRRVQDAKGTPGDMINFLIIGSEEKVVRSLLAAGWVKVDRTTKDAVLRGAIATISKQAYIEMPMSELMLMGRAQDYGWAHAVPLVVVAQRHHFRLWKAPFTVDGETLWIGAGTHDVGFDRDQRTGSITHKIDPKVDGEREFIRESLLQTGQVSEFSYVTPKNPLTSAKTAHGQEFSSDGRVLVLRMVKEGSDRAQQFAELFCSVLRQQPDAAEWGDCSQYLDAKAEGKLSLGPLSRDYRVLIVPGVLNSCAEATPAYQEGQKYLSEKHGLTVELLAVPNESAETNAKEIADYLKQKFAAEKRKYIVFGYSKGAPDLQTMLALYPETKDMVAAFVSVAGAVGGSPIAEVMPAQAEKWMGMANFGTCRGDLARAFKSLRRDVRQAFLKQYPRLPVPTYSLPAISDRSNTSKMLLQTWQLVATYDSRQDGQITRLDAVLPGSVYLGSALADHFAVALPLANTNNPQIRSLVDKNRYPRTALLEAMIRFVTQDLEATKPKAQHSQ